MAIEIVDFPIENWEIFHSYVKLPEGKTRKKTKKTWVDMGHWTNHLERTCWKLSWVFGWLIPDPVETYVYLDEAMFFFFFRMVCDVNATRAIGSRSSANWSMSTAILDYQRTYIYSNIYHRRWLGFGVSTFGLSKKCASANVKDLFMCRQMDTSNLMIRSSNWGILPLSCGSDAIPWVWI